MHAGRILLNVKCKKHLFTFMSNFFLDILFLSLTSIKELQKLHLNAIKVPFWPTGGNEPTPSRFILHSNLSTKRKDVCVGRENI